MTVTITPEEMYFGAPGTLTVGGVDVGALVEAPKLTFEIERFTPEIKNAKGPVKGTAIVRRVVPKLEVMISQLSAVKLAWAMPGCSAVSGAGSPTAGGADTTLAADTAAGATTISVASATGIATSNFLRIGDAGEYEIRQVTNVAGTTITLDAPLLRAHDSGDQVLEVDDRGTTTITWTPGRVPSADYREVILVAPGLDGRLYTVTLANCMSARNIEMEFDDEKLTGLPLELVAHYDPATPTVVPCSIVLA